MVIVIIPLVVLTGGGYNGSSNNNTIDYVEIATTGNALDFGNLKLQEEL